jgi:hypothetical protein
MDNYKDTKKNNMAKMFLSIFVFIVIIIMIFLCMYYLTPNTFLIEKYFPNKYILSNTERITMEPNSEIIFDYNIYKNYYLKIKSKKIDKLNVLYYNTLKSQNVKLKSGYLIKSKFYSNLKIINKSKHRTIITIKYYNKV